MSDARQRVEDLEEKIEDANEEAEDVLAPEELSPGGPVTETDDDVGPVPF